jgi:DNA polymerase I-like protein with 3'-5' exonuclease and polymerase domains
MFGKSEADVTDSERTVAKMINFGIAYGITPVVLFTRLRPQGVDVTLEQCEQFHAALPEGARLLSIVHDEFIVECRQEQAEDVRLLVVETMQAAPEGFVAPMVVEAKIAANWGDAKWRRPTDQKCPCGAAVLINSPARSLSARLVAISNADSS